MEDILIWLLSTQYGLYVTAGFAVLGGLVSVASAIVPFTKTPKDDEFVGKAKAFMARFSVLEPKK
jgi:hypothetical protein